MLGVGGLSLSLGRAGEGGGGSRGGGHLSRRMLLLERPFLPRFLHIHDMEEVFSESSESDTSENQPGTVVRCSLNNLCWEISAWQQDYQAALGVVYSYIII